MDTQATQPPPKPDLLVQAGELLHQYAAGKLIGGQLDPQRNGLLVIAASLLAIAGELRDINGTLNDIADRLPPAWMQP